MNERAEFETLLAGLCDGPSDVARNDRLNVLLHKHPGWQADYVDHLQLHAILRWRSGFGETGGAVTAEPASPASTRRHRVARIAAAVAVASCLAVGVGVAFLGSAPHAQASAEVVGQLVDWNLEISQARSPEARQAVHDARHDDFTVLLADTRLPLEDRELANSLIDTGIWLTRNNDPVAEAERFGMLADKLLARLDTTATVPDEQHAGRLADAYQRLAAVGVAGNIERIATARPLDQSGKVRMERVIANHTGRAKRLEDLLNRKPEASQKAIHRALKGHSRKQHAP